MTTIEITGGDLGSEKIRVRCDLTQASAPVQVDYDNGEGWLPTQYQCADCSHRASGLAEIGMELAAQAVEIPVDEFSAEWREID